MKRFTLTKEHVKLLRRAYVSWEDCEFGAPSINCKRPYGNSDVVRDMVAILDVPTFTDQDGEQTWDRATDERLRKLHAETETALQVVLSVGTFEPGVYVVDDYRSNWRAAP